MGLSNRLTTIGTVQIACDRRSGRLKWIGLGESNYQRKNRRWERFQLAKSSLSINKAIKSLPASAQLARYVYKYRCFSFTDYCSIFHQFEK